MKPFLSVISRACQWIAPWNVQNYPGHKRCLLAILARPITYASVLHWKAGRRRPSAWACEALAAYITSRCEVGLALATELELLAEQSREAERLRRLHTAEQLSRHGRPIVLLPDD